MSKKEKPDQRSDEGSSGAEKLIQRSSAVLELCLVENQYEGSQPVSQKVEHVYTLLLHSTDHGWWEFPGGGVVHAMRGEVDATKDAFRELKEESGIGTDLTFDFVPQILFLPFDSHIPKTGTSTVIFNHAFLFRAKVKQMPEVILSDDHDDYVWVDVRGLYDTSKLRQMGTALRNQADKGSIFLQYIDKQRHFTRPVTTDISFEDGIKINPSEATTNLMRAYLYATNGLPSPLF
jgi:8-oxo-dGTP pyrophosphatase MutT (NUDIX family)